MVKSEIQYVRKMYAIIGRRKADNKELFITPFSYYYNQERVASMIFPCAVTPDVFYSKEEALEAFGKCKKRNMEHEEYENIHLVEYTAEIVH